MRLGTPRSVVEVIETLRNNFLRNNMPDLARHVRETLIRIAPVIFIWAREIVRTVLYLA